MEEQSVLMDETERDELGEASGLLLDIAEQDKLVDPVFGGLDVSVHQGRGAADAASMRGADHLLPLFGGKFVAGEHVAHVVVENLCGGSRQSIEAVFAQHSQV